MAGPITQTLQISLLHLDAVLDCMGKGTARLRLTLVRGRDPGRQAARQGAPCRGGVEAAARNLRHGAAPRCRWRCSLLFRGQAARARQPTCRHVCGGVAKAAVALLHNERDLLALQEGTHGQFERWARPNDRGVWW